MDYTISKTIHRSFNEAIDSIAIELKKEGFGIITEVDLKEKFKEKLGVDFRNYKILGACNPSIANRAVQIEDKIGVMLPCNILVQEKENGDVEVSAINPVKTIGVVNNRNLDAIAIEVSEKLNRALDNVS